jgi:hypothetical protein
MLVFKGLFVPGQAYLVYSVQVFPRLSLSLRYRSCRQFCWCFQPFSCKKKKLTVHQYYRFFNLCAAMKSKLQRFNILFKSSVKYRVRINYYRSILQNYIFTNTEQKYMMLLPFERGMFAVSSATTTPKLPSERALNRHKTLTSRKFQDTPTALER